MSSVFDRLLWTHRAVLKIRPVWEETVEALWLRRWCRWRHWSFGSKAATKAWAAPEAQRGRSAERKIESQGDDLFADFLQNQWRYMNQQDI